MGGGVYGRYALSDLVSFQVEARYGGRGAGRREQVITSDGRTVDASLFYEFQYVDIPFLVQVAPMKSPVLVYAGPNIAFCTSARIRLDLGEPGDPQEIPIERVNDIGLSVGVAAKVPKIPILIDGRVMWGSQEVLKSHDKTRTITLSAGYGF
jgi:hypothetical protein